MKGFGLLLGSGGVPGALSRLPLDSSWALFFISVLTVEVARLGQCTLPASAAVSVFGDVGITLPGMALGEARRPGRRRWRSRGRWVSQPTRRSRTGQQSAWGTEARSWGWRRRPRSWARRGGEPCRRAALGGGRAGAGHDERGRRAAAGGSTGRGSARGAGGRAGAWAARTPYCAAQHWVMAVDGKQTRGRRRKSGHCSGGEGCWTQRGQRWTAAQPAALRGARGRLRPWWRAGWRPRTRRGKSSDMAAAPARSRAADPGQL